MTDNNLVNDLMALYGWASVDQMKTSKEWNEAKTRLQDNARRTGQAHPTGADVIEALSKKVTPNANVAGFYLRHDVFRNKQKEITGEGPHLLLADGSEKTFATGEDMGLPFMTRVVVTNVRLSQNLIKGTMSVEKTKDTKVVVQQHEAPIPTVTLKDAIDRCMQQQTGGKNSRFVIRGESGDFPVTAHLTITDEKKDISYWPAGGKFEKATDSLKVVARDATSQGYLTTIDPQKARDAYGLGEDASASDFRDALAGEPVVASGRLNLFMMGLEAKDFGKDADEAIAAVTGPDGLVTNGAWVETSARKGTHGMSLKGRFNKKPDGTLEPMLFLTIGNRMVYDIREEKMPGNVRYFLLARDEGKLPSFSTVSYPWENENGSGTMNEHGNVFFPNGRTNGPRVRAADDPAVLAARQLGLDEVL